VAKQKKNQLTAPATPIASPIVATASPLFIKRYLPQIIIATLTFIIYSNSLLNGYAIDDTMVLTDNKFTKRGIDGVKDIFTSDAFVGFFGERGNQLVSGGRYRPLSIATLAVEYEISRKLKGDTRTEINEKNIIIGENDPYLAPMVSHAINVLLFIFCCLLLYSILKHTLKEQRPFYVSIAFIATLLFAAHPIHTEAVTNIKGRDEVMGLLFSLATLYLVLKFSAKNNLVTLLAAVALFFLGLLSKENTITFLAIIPLTLYFFTKTTLNQYIKIAVALLIPAVIYLLIRKSYTAAGVTAESPEILNNPFAFTNGSFELRYATVIYTFLLYIKLLILPLHLTHDYYFNQIPYVKFSDIGFILSLLINGALVGYVIFSFRKKEIPAYAILFYFITFSVVSNLLFTVGILMNERFMFFSSVGFCLLLGYGLVQGAKRFNLSNHILLALTGIILLLYSVKTFSRNFDWKDNFTLFMTDVKVSDQSAKIHTSCGGDLAKNADKEPDSLKRKAMMQESIAHLKKAIEIYPTHSNAWLLLGNSIYKVNKDPQEAIAIYKKAAEYRVGGYYDALYNIGCVEVENGMAAASIENFKKALAIKDDVFECKYNLAEAYSKTNQFDSAILWYQKALLLKPNDAASYYKIGTIYGKQLGDLANAIVNLEKALSLSPDTELYYEDLAVAYGLKGDIDKAINTSLNCLKVNPNYAPALNNLVVSYTIKGDKPNADLHLQQLQRVQQLGLK